MSKHPLNLAGKLLAFARPTPGRLVGLALLLACGIHFAAARPLPAQDATSDDPVARALLDTKPQTPEELIEVASILIDLKQATLAKPLVAQLAGAGLDAGELVRLGRKFGTGTMLKLALADELQPEGMQFSLTVMQAMAADDRDPQRMGEAIGRLNAPEFSVRATAVEQLARGGATAAAALVNVLVDPARADEVPGVMAALLVLGRDALDPLSVARQAGDPAVRQRVLTVLARIPHEDAVAWLLRPASDEHATEAERRIARQVVEQWRQPLPTVSQAGGELYSLARALYQPPPPLAADPAAPVWHWDDAAGQLVEQPGTRRLAELQRAVRLARDASALAPADGRVRRLLLAAQMQAELMFAGQTDAGQANASTAIQALIEAGPDTAVAVAQEAADAGNTPVALAALSAVAQAADANWLTATAPRPSPLVELCRHADRQVRFAAVATLLSLKPDTHFAGSSYVLDALRYFVATHGAPRALVADLRPEEAQRLAGMLSGLGYQVDTAFDGRGLIGQAIASPDYELALVDIALAGPTSGELLSQLRRDARTARLPVAVVSSPIEAYRHEVDDLRKKQIEKRVELLAQFGAALHGQLDMLHAPRRPFERELVELAFSVPPHESLYQRLRSPERAGSFELVVLDDLVTRSLDEIGPTVQGLEVLRAQIAGELLRRLSQDVARAETLARRDRRAMAFVRPYTQSAMDSQVERLLRQAGGGMSTAPRRIEQAQAALAWLAEAAAEPPVWLPLRNLVGVLTEAAWMPELSRSAIEVLAGVGDPSAQRTLVDIASLPAQPLETRQAAGAAFAASVDRYGTLLTTSEILRQYDRYNASETLDQPTQQVLGAILDVVEARAAAHPALPNQRPPAAPSPDDAASAP